MFMLYRIWLSTGAGEEPPRPWELEAEHAAIDARATRAFEKKQEEY